MTAPEELPILSHPIDRLLAALCAEHCTLVEAGLAEGCGQQPITTEHGIKAILLGLQGVLDVTKTVASTKQWLRRKPFCNSKVEGSQGCYYMAVLHPSLLQAGLHMPDGRWAAIQRQVEKKLIQKGGLVRPLASRAAGAAAAATSPGELSPAPSAQSLDAPSGSASSASPSASSAWHDLEIESLRRKLEYSQGELRAARKREYYWRNECEKTRAKSMTPTPGSNMVDLAVRRNLSHCAAQAVASTLGLDVHRTTVVRWEQRVAATIIAEARAFYKACDERVSKASWSVAVHSFKGDATNSGVMQQSKLQASELHSCYLVEDPEAPLGEMHDYAEDVSFVPGWAEHKVWGDTQKIKDQSGLGTLGMAQKQIQGCGCQTWGGDNHGGQQPPEQSFRVWIYTSDAGTDQVKASGFAQLASMGSRVRDFFFKQLCWLHQLQIIVKLMLCSVDSAIKHLNINYPRHYASGICKLLHMWRSTNHPALIFQKWAELYGDMAAMRYARKVPPKPIMGRWHSMDNCEVFRAHKSQCSWFKHMHVYAWFWGALGWQCYMLHV